MSRTGFLIFAAALSAQPIMARAPSCGIDGLPSPVRRIVSEQFKTWKILQVSDLSSDDKQLWFENYNQYCPGILKGNFAGDQSYALALKKNIGSKIYQQIIVIRLQDYKNIFILGKPDYGSRPSVLLKAPPGKYRNFYQRSNHVITRFDGIVDTTLEANAVLFISPTENLKASRSRIEY